MSMRLKILKKPDFIFSLLGTIAASITLFVFLTGILNDNFVITKTKSSGLKEYEREFFISIEKIIQISDSSSITIPTIKKVFNAIDRKSEGRLFNYGFVNVLEDYCVEIIQDSTKINKSNFRTVIKLIDEELSEEPFNQLPAEQRRILINLRKSLKNNDSEGAVFNLNELNDILRIRNESYVSLKRQNAWSIPLAVIGIVLTLIFGLMSLFKSIGKGQNNK